MAVLDEIEVGYLREECVRLVSGCPGHLRRRLAVKMNADEWRSLLKTGDCYFGTVRIGGDRERFFMGCSVVIADD